MANRSRSSLWGLWLGGVATLAVASALLRRRFELRDRVVLITGGSRGLGLELARAFGARGAHVAIAARDPDELARAQGDLVSRGVGAFTIVADVSDSNGIDTMLRATRERFGRLDVLVNNAGVMTVGPWGVMNEQDFATALDTHLWGPLRSSLRAVPALRETRGRIVNIVSIGGIVPIPHMLPYATSKFALAGFSESFAVELASQGISIVTVCPGLMRTGSTHRASFKGRHRAEHAWFAVSASLPGISMNAARAARRIVRATERGERFVVLTSAARWLARFHAIAPALFGRIASLVARWLPSPRGGDTSARSGSASRSAIAPSWLTRPSDRAAARNNEL